MNEEIEIYKDGNIVGCNEKQIDIVDKILKKGKRTFGSSGASLTHQISNPEYKETGINSKLASIGLAGEHETSKILREWIKDKPNVVLVDSVHIKGHGKEELNEETGTLDGGDTDHVIIIGSYIILIDSKNWKGTRKYGVNEKGEVTRSGKPFPGGKVNSRGALFLWRKYLNEFSPKFSSLIVITADKVFVTRDVNWWKQSFKVVTKETFLEFLGKIWDQIPDNDKHIINSSLVASIVSNTIKPYDSMKEKLGSAYYLLK